MIREAIQTYLVDNGVVVIRDLHRKELWSLQQAWRQVYAIKVKAETGKWIYRGVDWHTFSFGFAKCLEGNQAYREYEFLPPCGFLVIPDNPNTQNVGLLCRSKAMPDLREFGDVYVSDPQLDWTMVFTHEHGSCGPYFARKEWQPLGNCLTEGDWPPAS